MNNLNHSRTFATPLLAAALLLASAGSALAGVRYVDVNSASNSPPYTSWATAATNIQDAVDAAVAGDEIVVTNGIYSTGGRAVAGFTTNRVAVDKPLTLRSVNGPQSTTIDGGPSVRCVYLTNGANLSGGGVFYESTNSVVSNCVVSGNVTTSPGRFIPIIARGGGAYGGTLNNCILSGNNAFGIGEYGDFDGEGGGACNAILNNCTLTRNSAVGGGGASSCTLNNCHLIGNSVGAQGQFGDEYGSGGGASGSTLNNCALTGNSAIFGGGAVECTLNNCTLTGNSATDGGGASYSTLNNCFLTGNSPYGAFSSTLDNCTLTGNAGGVAFGCTLTNCIAYFNLGPNYDSSSTLNYCCTTPQPPNGLGNISLDPQLADSSHLSAASPCRGAGNAAWASGSDIDGEPWATPPSIGCDEYHAGALTGPLSVAIIAASFKNVSVGFAVRLTALIEGRTAASSWDFGDGLAVTNQPYTSHAWTAPGDYVVVLRAFNESQPGGIIATVTVHVVTGVHYVSTKSANPVAPYTSWATAATNIQEAIDVAVASGAVVVVTNGNYAPIRVYSTFSVRSVNGALFTVIDGGQSNRCASLSSDASLSGFTLTNGASFYYEGGGGAAGGTLNNCTLSGNLATGSPAFGGGPIAAP